MVKTREGLTITPGKRYDNKTARYLAPCLKDWGQELESNTFSNYILAVGIGDSEYSEEIPDRIFLLFDVNGKRRYNKYPQKSNANFKFGEYLEFIKYHPAYVDDYVYDNMQDGNQHMVILTLPQHFKDSELFDKFLQGRYSEMYTSEEMERLFSRVLLKDRVKIDNPQYLIINKDPNYEETFREKLMEDFDINRPTYDISDREWDYKPFLSEEVFNYEQKNKISLTL